MSCRDKGMSRTYGSAAVFPASGDETSFLAWWQSVPHVVGSQCYPGRPESAKSNAKKRGAD